MLGHPGISAFEYAYVPSLAERKREERKGEGSFKRALTPSIATSTVSGYEEHGSQVSRQEISEPESLLQRRRGTFINHTPRHHEALPQKRVEPHTSIPDSRYYPYSSFYGSSDESTDASYNQADHHSSFGSLHGRRANRAGPIAPAELDSKEVYPESANKAQTHRYENSAASPEAEAEAETLSDTKSGAPRPSMESTKTRREQARDRKLRDLKTLKTKKKNTQRREEGKLKGGDLVDVGSAMALAARLSEPPTSTGHTNDLKEAPKRRRRQTPYKVPKPVLVDSPRYSPLEPLVAQHRREITGSDVEPLPPHVDIDELNATATFMAMNEYFDSQGQLTFGEQEAENVNDHSPFATVPTFPAVADGLEVPNERLSQSDFDSAANGHYSPYERQGNGIEKRPLAARQIQTVSPITCRIAPPIPDHEELTTRAKLNDFNHFMRNTGPPPEHRKPPKNWSLAIHKVRSKRNISTDEHGPEKPSPVIPSCAKEMRTTSGKKHLQIVIPQDRENLKAEVGRLERLAREMSEELAAVAEMDISDGNMSPEEVLQAYKAHKHAAE